MNNEYISYISEINQIEYILAMIPEKNVMERESFEARLELAQEALKRLSPDDSNVKITFAGKPVIGQKGIFVDFATKALDGFTNAYNKIAGTEKNNQTKAKLL